MFTTREVHWAISECIRQQTGPQEVENLLMALEYAQAQRKLFVFPQLVDVKTIASIIEPFKAAKYRQTPVVFNQGEVPLKWEHIERQMQLLFNNIELILMPIDDFIKRLLVIHPWEDGNGRTASIVYNWFKDSLEDPMSLPYYFGEREK